MQPLLLDEVATSVVAWHNRHPLARRIDASQVHSIGEVVLPFASAQPQVRLTGPPGLPTAAELLDPAQGLGNLAPAIDTAPGAFAAHLAATRAEAAARRTAPAGQRLDAEPGSGSPAAEAVEPGLQQETHGQAPSAPTPAVPADSAAETDPNRVAPGEADLPLPMPTMAFAPAPDTTGAEAHADLSLAITAPPSPGAASRPNLALAAAPAAAPTAGRLPAWLRWLTGRRAALPRLQPTFSHNFIWPLSARQVARWARRHGQPQPVAPADWPRRVVASDATLLAAARGKGLQHASSLHLLTAAIGVDDRRIRLLMDAQGVILGPRAYSRPRLAIAGGLVAAALLGAGWARLPPALPVSTQGAALADASASAPPAVAAAGSAASAVTAASAASAAFTTKGADPAPAPAAVAEPALARAAAPEPAPAPAARVASTPAAPAAKPGPPQQAAAPTAKLAPDAGPTIASQAAVTATLGRIRPQLSAEARRVARQQADLLRGAPVAAPAPLTPPTPPAPTKPRASPARPELAATAATVYAVVTRPDRQRDAAASSLATMRSAASRLPALPPQLELMQHQGSWRAAWWPFVSLADAERARVLLAGKGVKTEVVAF